MRFGGMALYSGECFFSVVPKSVNFETATDMIMAWLSLFGNLDHFLASHDSTFVVRERKMSLSLSSSYGCCEALLLEKEPPYGRIATLTCQMGRVAWRYQEITFPVQTHGGWARVQSAVMISKQDMIAIDRSRSLSSSSKC